MKMKKIGLLAMALVLALGLTGAAFAHWTDTVLIEETVTTGNVCVAIRDIGTDDDPGDNDDVANCENNYDPGWKGGVSVCYDKDIASATSQNIEWKCNHDNTHFYAKIKETITNAYPSYAPTMVMEIANCGSIPVIITGVEEHHTVQCPMLFHVQIVHYELSGPASIGTITGSGWLEMVDHLTGIQIDPCEVLTVEVTKHIAQEAPGPEYAVGGSSDPVPCPQNTYCYWEETIHFTQWNCAE